MNRDQKLIDFTRDDQIRIKKTTDSVFVFLEFLYGENIFRFGRLNGFKWPRGKRILISTCRDLVFNPDQDYQQPVCIPGPVAFHADLRGLARRPVRAISLILQKLDYSEFAIENAVIVFDPEERKKANDRYVQEFLKQCNLA